VWADGPKRRLTLRQTGDKSNYVSVHPVRWGESKACLRADHLELADDLPLPPEG